MYKDLITYNLATWVTIEQLKELSQKVWTDRMSLQEGCVWREINSDAQDTYTDIVYWMSKEHAEKANKTMDTNPHAQAWMACYDMDSIKSTWLTAQATYNKGGSKPNC